MGGKWLWKGVVLAVLAGWTSSFFAGAGGSKDKSVKECKGVLTGAPDPVCVSLQAGRNRCLRIPRSQMKGPPCTLVYTRSPFSLTLLLRNPQKMTQTLSRRLHHPVAWTPGVPAANWSKPSAKERAGA